MKFTYTLLICYGFILINCDKLPADIQKCHSGDSDCIIKVSNDLLRKYPGGRSDLNVPAIDPFFMKSVELNLPGGNALDINFKFKNLNVRGYSKFIFDRAVGFTKDPTTSKFEMYGKISKLEFDGHYNADGRVLILPFQGDGKFKMVLKDVKASLKFKPIPIKKSDGLTYLTMDKIKFLLEPKSVQLHFDNLFNGNEELGKAMNTVMNENWRDLWQEFSPPMFDIAENIMKDITTGLFQRFDYEHIYLD